MSDKGEFGIEYKTLQISDVLSRLYIKTLLPVAEQTSNLAHRHPLMSN